MCVRVCVRKLELACDWRGKKREKKKERVRKGLFSFPHGVKKRKWGKVLSH